MSDLTLTRIIAEQPLTCYQCFNRAESSSIAKGDTCVEILHPNGRISFACEECFDRLSAEIGASEIFGLPYIVDPRLSDKSEVFYDEAAWKARCAEQRRFDSWEEQE